MEVSLLVDSSFTAVMSGSTHANDAIQETVSIIYKDIPEYLWCTSFYCALSSEDNGEFKVPANCFWAGGTMSTNDDFRMYLQTQVFWGSSTLSLNALRFCFQQTEDGYSAEHLMHCFTILSDIFGDDSHLSRNVTKMLFCSEYKCSSMSKEGISASLKHAYRSRSHEQILFDFHAVSGEKESFTSLVESYGQCWDEITCEHAARNAHFEYVLYFIECGCTWDLGTCYFAAMHGRTDILKYCLDESTMPKAHRYNGWPQIAAVAAEYGHLSCLQFIFDQKHAWDVWACNAAAGGESLAVLQYLVEHGCPIDENTLLNAVSKGSFENVQYLFELGCPRSDDLCVYAIRRNSTEVLQYLMNNGCPINEQTSSNAPTVEALRMVMQNGCPHTNDFLPTMLPSLLLIDDFGDNLPYLTYIVEELLFRIDDTTFEKVMEFGRFSFIQYLIDAGCPFSQAVPFSSQESREISVYITDEEMCMSLILAVDRGWRINIEYVQRILDVEYVRCAQYLRAEGVFPEITESPAFISLCERSL